MAPTDDISSLLGVGDLNSFNQSVVQSDPYGIASRGLGAWQPSIETWSPTETGVTMFAKSFLSGLLGNYAQQNAANQLNSVIGVLPQLESNPMSVMAPEGVDAAPFAALKGSAVLKNYIGQASAAAERQKSVGDLLKTVLGEGVKNGDITPGQAVTALTSKDPAAALTALSPDETGGSRIGKLLDSYGITDPAKRAGIRTSQEAHDLLLHVEEQDDKKAAAQEKADAKLQNQLKNAIEKKDTPYQTALVLAPLQKVADQLINSDQPDAQTDMALFDVLNKVYNPGGVLREGLMQMSKDATSSLNKIQAIITNTFTQPGAVLSDDQRQRVYNVIKEGIGQKTAEGKSYLDNAMSIARTGGANPDMVISPDYYNHLFSAPTITPPSITGGINQDALRQEATQLKAQGLSNEQVAATLRSKYGG